MTGLTAKQKQILDFCVGYTVTNLSFPTFHRILKHTGKTGTNNVSDHFSALIKKGFLDYRKVGKSGRYALSNLTKEIYSVVNSFEIPVEIIGDSSLSTVSARVIKNGHLLRTSVPVVFSTKKQERQK